MKGKEGEVNYAPWRGGIAKAAFAPRESLELQRLIKFEKAENWLHNKAVSICEALHSPFHHCKYVPVSCFGLWAQCKRHAALSLKTAM